MSIRIGIYDFFAFTVPGIFYLLTSTYVGIILGLIKIDFNTLTEVSVLFVILMALVAYVIGLLLDPIARQWYCIFCPKDVYISVFEEFKTKHDNLKIKFDAKDWYILLTYFKRDNIEIASDIERYNATRIMLRNISLSFLILGIIQGVQFFRMNFSLGYVISSFILLILTIIALIQCIKYDKWFYSAIYQTAAVYIWDFSKLEINKSKSKKRNEI